MTTIDVPRPITAKELAALAVNLTRAHVELETQLETGRCATETVRYACEILAGAAQVIAQLIPATPVTGL